MLGTILDECVKEVKEKVEGFVQKLKAHCDFSRLEGVLCGMVRELENKLLQAVSAEVFACEFVYSQNAKILRILRKQNGARACPSVKNFNRSRWRFRLSIEEFGRCIKGTG